jgi:hypothetical protein
MHVSCMSVTCQLHVSYTYWISVGTEDWRPVRTSVTRQSHVSYMPSTRQLHVTKAGYLEAHLADVASVKRQLHVSYTPDTLRPMSKMLRATMASSLLRYPYPNP